MRGVASLLVLSLSACSFALSGPRTPARAGEHCDTEADAPTLDVAGAVAFLGIATAAFVSDATARSGAEMRGAASLYVGAPSAVIGIVYAVAAADGFDTLARCKSTRRQQEELAEGHARGLNAGSAAASEAVGSAAIVESAAERSWQSSHE